MSPLGRGPRLPPAVDIRPWQLRCDVGSPQVGAPGCWREGSDDTGTAGACEGGLIEGSTSTPMRIVARGTCLATQLLLCTWLAGCASVHHYATERLGDAMASGGSGFSGDDDPELIRAAAPFSLKAHGEPAAGNPQHAGLLTATAAGFTEYAYAFVQEDADELEAHDVAASLELRRRAHGLYLRARDYGMRALATRHANFGAKLRHSSAAAAAELDQRDAPAIYWTAASWAASISLDKDSPDALADLPLFAALLGRLQTLDADYDHGALDALLMSYESGRPGARDPQTQVRHHFERAVRPCPRDKRPARTWRLPRPCACRRRIAPSLSQRSSKPSRSTRRCGRSGDLRTG